jgi:hypothetical protein
MKYLVLSVLVVIVQASSPAPRKTTDNPVGTAANIQSKSDNNQANPTPSPAPRKTDSNGPTKGDSGEQHPEDAQHTIGISKIPTVTLNPITRDWVDWGYWAFSGLLVIVGGLQTVLLRMQWKVFHRQTRFQEIALKQWIEIPEKLEIKPIREHEGKMIAEITFGLLNPTNYPLTLDAVSFDISSGEPTEMSLGTVLAPHKTKLFGTYVVLTKEQEDSRQASALSLFIDGRIKFTTALGDKATQTFTGGIACEKTNATFIDCTRVEEPANN